jgi:hypothetical protein
MDRRQVNLKIYSFEIMKKTTKKKTEGEESVPVSETNAEKTLRFTRQCRHFIEYIGYDWNTDTEWDNFKKTNLT